MRGIGIQQGQRKVTGLAISSHERREQEKCLRFILISLPEYIVMHFKGDITESCSLHQKPSHVVQHCQSATTDHQSTCWNDGTFTQCGTAEGQVSTCQNRYFLPTQVFLSIVSWTERIALIRSFRLMVVWKCSLKSFEQKLKSQTIPSPALDHENETGIVSHVLTFVLLITLCGWQVSRCTAKNDDGHFIFTFDRVVRVS